MCFGATSPTCSSPKYLLSARVLDTALKPSLTGCQQDSHRSPVDSSPPEDVGGLCLVTASPLCSPPSLVSLLGLENAATWGSAQPMGSAVPHAGTKPVPAGAHCLPFPRSRAPAGFPGGSRSPGNRLPTPRYWVQLNCHHGSSGSPPPTPPPPTRMPAADCNSHGLLLGYQRLALSQGWAALGKHMLR